MEEGAGREGKLQGETPGAATCNPRSRGRPAASTVEAASHEPCGGPAGPAGPAAAAGALAPHGRARLAQRGSSSAAAPAAAAGVLFLRPTGPGERPVARGSGFHQRWQRSAAHFQTFHQAARSLVFVLVVQYSNSSPA